MPSRIAVGVLQLCSNKFEVDVAIDQAMIFRNLIFESEVVKQRFRTELVSHHEQQASERNGEQQHRELWPAYNAIVAPPQASTEGLFQQTQAIAQACAVSSPETGFNEFNGDISRATVMIVSADLVGS